MTGRSPKEPDDNGTGNKAHKMTEVNKSSFVSRDRQQRDEPWKARAPESKESVQALAVGITTPWSGSGGAYKSQTYCPRLEGLVPWF
jgi:hypothetical protein